MIEYKILKANDSEDLEEAINEVAEDGWRLKGNIVAFELHLIATMYRT
jgi:hypothetical protein